MLRVILAPLLVLALLSGCVSSRTDDNSWPASLPALDYYLSIYDRDTENQKIQSRDEYLTWVIRFYQGWTLFSQGWHEMTSEVLSGIDNAGEREHVQADLARLGKQISGEWAKDSKSRLIFTPTVAAWGHALLESMQRNEVSTLVGRVSADVESLFAGELESSAISMDRYYAQDSSDFF